MPNGDLVSGCSDGIVRVFSEHVERWAPPEVLKSYDDALASQALPSQQIGDINKEQLQGTEGLNIPGRLRYFRGLLSTAQALFVFRSGKKDGEVKMIRNGSIVEAYTVSEYTSASRILFHAESYSGTARTANGKKSARLLMLSAPLASSSTKERNTITYLTSISRITHRR
jgi:hypothetical protein